MTQKRKMYDDHFKAKVALPAIRETETIAELSSRYNVHSTQIRKWKSKFLENAAIVFGGDKEAAAENKSLRSERVALHKRIGEQTLDIDFLKKSLKKVSLL